MLSMPKLGVAEICCETMRYRMKIHKKFSPRHVFAFFCFFLIRRAITFYDGGGLF